jgi:hypothetical protein
MTTAALPIAGHPYLALAAQTDDAFHRRIITNLRARGFVLEPGQLVPPAGADGKAIIAAITFAFQEARRA